MGVIWIDNKTATGSLNAKDIISQKIENENIPPVLIFPQGTTTNTQALTMFKTGAFLTGMPVLPVTIRFTNKFGDLSFFGDNILLDAIIPWCQFINYGCITILNPYYPNEQEKTNKTLYANNVRALIAIELKAALTRHSFDDFMFDNMAKQLGFRTHLQQFRL